MPPARSPDLARLRGRRDGARWTVAVGIGMLFVSQALIRFGGLAISILMGGVLMVLYGMAAWAFWGWRLHKADDPWAYDPELDGPKAQVLHGRLPEEDPDEGQKADVPRAPDLSQK